MLRRGLVNRTHAVSAVISGLLALVITTSTIGTVIMFGVPYIDSVNEEKSKENAEMQISAVFNSIKNIASSSNIDDLKQYKIPLDDNSYISVGEEKDTTILMYSTDPNYDFTISGLGDGDSLFKIKMLSGQITKADIFWLNFNQDTCFLAGTKVLLSDGTYKNIEDINVGDIVFSYNEITMDLEFNRVVNVFHHTPQEMSEYYLVINNGLKVTPNHRFYSNNDWVYASDLKIGDSLFCKDKSIVYKIYSIEKVFDRKPSYDLEIQNCHDYFVLIEDGIDILVHNDQVTLYPTADTHVRQVSPTINYGTATELRIDPRATAAERILVKFDFSSIPVGSSITSAVLSLYYFNWSNTNPSARYYDCYRVTSSWTETGVNWNNKPTFTTPAVFTRQIDDTGSSPNYYGWKSWTVTGNVQSFVDGSYTNNGWMIGDQTEGVLVSYLSKYYSREYTGTTYDPKIVVDYTPLTVTTNDSSNVLESSATMNGLLDSEGTGTCTVFFQYGETVSYESSTLTQQKISGQSFSVNQGSLLKGTLYHYRAVATNIHGTKYGSDKTFLTKPGALSSFTANPISESQIDLSWTNNANGGKGAYIEYSPGSSLFPWNIGSGTAIGYINGASYQHKGLNPDTNYFYKIWPYAEDDLIKSDGSTTKPFGDVIGNQIISSTTLQLNRPPDAKDDSAVVLENSEDNQIDVLANDRDPDGNEINIISVTQPSRGIVSYNSDYVFYTPSANYFGSDSFTYTINDGYNGYDTATVFVTIIKANALPIADFSYSPIIPNTGDNVGFDASNSYDPDGTIISYEWDLDNDGQYDDATGIKAQYSWVIYGSHIVKLRVKDNSYEYGYVTKTVTVNQPPTVDISSPINGNTYSGSILITGSANDVDGSISLVQIKIDGGNWVNATGTNSWQYTWDSTQVGNGPHNISAKCKDNRGVFSSIDIVSIVINNPVADFTYSPTNPITNQIVNFDASTSSAEGGITSYKWDWNGDDIYDESSADPKTAHSWSIAGDYKVSLKVVDSKNLSDIKNITISVNTPNTPPIVVINSPDENDTVTGIIQISGKASDIDGDAIDLVQIKFDDEIYWKDASGKNDWTYNWNTEPYSNGEHTIHVRCLDSRGLFSEIISVSVNVYNSNNPEPPSREENEFIDVDSIETHSIGNPVDGVYNIVADKNIIGTVVIDIYDDEFYVGSIWYFESDSVTFNYLKNNVNSKMILDSNGVIEKDAESSSILSSPVRFSDNSIVTFSMIQLVKSSDSIDSVSSSNSKFNLRSKGFGMSRSDTFRNIETFRIQLYGDNSDIWNNYFSENNFNSEIDVIGSESITSLRYIPNHISLMMHHSFIEFSIN